MMLAASINAEVQNEASEPSLHILSAAALRPAAHSPSVAQLRPGREAEQTKGGKVAPATLALLGKQIWVHIRTPSPTSCVYGGKLRFLICEPGLITVKWGHVPQSTAQRTCFPQTCYYFYYYSYGDDQHYRSLSFSLSVYPPKSLKDLGLI